MQQVRVLIVDDSALVRQVLRSILEADPGIAVVGAAPDPLVAREMIKSLNPDVVTLDIEMPRMDGLAFLEKIMRLRPMPVVMISSLTQKGAETALRALEMGAVDFVGKPTVALVDGFAALGDEIIAKVKAAAAATVRGLSRAAAARPLSGDIGYRSSNTLIAIGASTGGVEALHSVLAALPPDIPPILVAQHMPPAFTESFAQRLDKHCAVAVSQARPGERILRGHVYVAPGGRHLELARSGGYLVCGVHDTPPMSGHRPSVDVLFRSVAQVAGANSIGVILTGMGNDGASGLLEMRRAGASTIGQDESSCVVYGMPKAARDCGAVEVEFPVDRIPEQILDRCRPMTEAVRRA